ncbi:2-succinyl-5-enolpyruvyl-6-hydroxy-3-cyclohexene-1-carboxylic-acid synthase [Thalassobacillus hwangdonensis]|uniref:2-succinyl-5-enolpyruvyl-6-hydroxy-3-cyclohexene-1-carboxylate synthase n=1 Tax=Thalassobacillus hwangdonensis TaxID=546108 RepID=A0ABW3L527_9BACI
MDHTETMTRYIAAFIQSLVEAGLKDVVISPGSRSTPLAMTCAEHPEVNHWVNLDERSAGFFALGIAKEQQLPVALICTSGTAAANYYPAIVEAYYSRIPLVVLTADRPHELRDTGAPQAIEQIKLYGDYVKWFHDLALPEAQPSMLNYAARTAARAVHEAEHGNSGPVHINIPLREPLVPDFTLSELWKPLAIEPPLTGKRKLGEQEVEWLLKQLDGKHNGLLVVGPQTDPALGASVDELATKCNLPVLADPLSGIRAGQHGKANIIETYDAILKSKRLKEALRPDFIIRFGAMPISKAYLQWLQTLDETNQIVVESEAGYREPSGTQTTFLYGDSTNLCEMLSSSMDEQHKSSGEWLEKWQSMNRTAKDFLLTKSDRELNEGHVVSELSSLMPEESILFAGNSMPIRDVDTFFMTTPKNIAIMANRGGNGIDGVTSAALGAGVYGKPVTLLIGDLSFFHDMNGLMAAKQYGLNLTVVLINNDGGGIFSYLPQAAHPKHFQSLFETPMGLDFKKAVELYDGSYHSVDNWDAFDNAVRASYHGEGLHVVEVRTNKADNVSFHKAKWKTIEEMLIQQLEG